ncbi:MAG: class I SAM-dependent methyltransferase [Flavobacterium sp.]|nr:class I SAM-dependent methyltransferase [Flavobacterium sp.]
MIDQLLTSEIQSYISQHVGTKSSALAFQKNPFPNIDFKQIINQIEAKTKAQDKLPTWFKTPGIIYPSKVSVEQTSSETTAQYKASLVSGNSLFDATGGFGIDAYYFAKKVQKVVHCELNHELSELVQHNFKTLQCNSIECMAGNSSEILKDLNQPFDHIYIDPSRRNDQKGKVFMLQDCLPNVPELQDFYFNYTDQILIKTAPILDITSGLTELKNVKNIHIVAVDNEVKELLWEIEKNYSDSITIKTIHFHKNKKEEFEFQRNNPVTVNYTVPDKFLFEPNSALMKSGGFNEVAHHFKLNKLHTHSHLYTASEPIEFPGRVFIIIQNIPYSKNEMKTHLQNTNANITTRNFPESVDTIRKKWKIKEGGTTYCFFTTDKNDNKIVLICKKI